MITGILIAAAFISVVLVLYWLTEKPKPPRSQYTLPPLKRTIQQRVEDGYYGEHRRQRWEELKRDAEMEPRQPDAALRKLYGEPLPAPCLTEQTLREIKEDGFLTDEQYARASALVVEGAEQHHTKDAFVEAMVDAKPDESLSHSDVIDHDHGGKGGHE